MNNDISLNAAMRSNLLSLQNIAGKQNIVQNRLATGLKVSSAIDNPSSFYTAQSLNNRASDLTALLDSMAQGIQTIKAANEAIEAGTKMLEQAKAVADTALETVQPIVARVSTEAELLAAIDSGQKGLIVLSKDITLSENRTLTLQEDQSLVGVGYLNKTSAATKLNFNITTDNISAITTADKTLLANLDINIQGDHLEKLIGINNNDQKNLTLQNTSLSVDLNNAYYVKLIQSVDSNVQISGKVNLMDLGANSYTVSDDNTYITAFSGGRLDLNGNARLNILTKTYGGDGIQNAFVNADDKSQINIKHTGHWGRPINNSTVTVRKNSALYIDSTTESVQKSTLNMYDSSKLLIKNYLHFGGQSHALTASNLNLNSNQVEVILQTTSPAFASYSGQNPSSVSAVAGARILTNTGTWIAQTDITNLNLAPPNTSDLPTAYFDKTDSTASSMPGYFINIFNDFENYAATDSLPDEKENTLTYKKILSQYDQLIADGWYKGVNLLDGQNLAVNFNEDRSSQIEIKGAKAKAEDLGLTTTEWNSAEDIEQSVSELGSAISQLRQMGAEFGNYYSIVSNREEFTENLINVLTEGADKLTLADMNAESANMLALQTAQQLAVNSLSLASQAAQSVLKLF